MYHHTTTTLDFTMTSSNGNIFRVTGPLCGEFTGHRWINFTKAMTRSFDVLWSAPWINGVNNREASDLRRYRAHCDVIVMFVAHYVSNDLDKLRIHTDANELLLRLTRNSLLQMYIFYEWNNSHLSMSASYFEDDIWNASGWVKTFISSFKFHWNFLGWLSNWQ